VHGQSAAPAPMASQAEPPATPPAGLACTPSKRERDSGGSSSSCEPRVSKVRFSHVTVRELGMEIWGGGGVPADDGPPLGLSWDLQSTRHVNIDDWEAEREQSRTPKDSYCFEGCVEPNVRRQMLLGAGSTHKQIKAATKAVAQLNQDRWKASEVLFGDAWLFRAPGRAEPLELLAMLGQPEGRGFELKVANWDCAEACARELAKPLNVSPEALLLAADDDEGSGEESGEESSAEEGIAWSAATAAMQGLAEQAVLMIRCESEGAGAHAHGLGLAFLGRIVGCVANAHIASQVLHSRRGNVSVVLRGWAEDKIEADWSEDEPDEFCISPLH